MSYSLLSATLTDAYSALTEGDFVWILVGICPVFFMQAGFAMVETGFTRAKNAGNIIMKKPDGLLFINYLSIYLLYLLYLLLNLSCRH